MRYKFQRAVGIVVAICVLMGALNVLSGLVERKDSSFKYAPFFEQQGDFDVLFMGSSHVLNAFFPVELWKDFGIVSYNFGGHWNQVPTSYWVVENALDYTTPKLIIIDCFFLNSNIKTAPIFSYEHTSLDAFPLNFTKVSSVCDLLDDKEMESRIELGNIQDAELRTEAELLWEYTVYHSRWDSLVKSDFELESTREKGAESRIAVAVPNEVTYVQPDEKLEGETVGTEYLRRIIEDCQDRDIEVLLTYLPFLADEDCQREANRVYDIATEYGINYINFLDLNVVDYSTDCYDAGHLNPSGARKVTDYLGQYIMEHYDISDQRNNEVYSGWYQDYEDYVQLKFSNLKAQKSLDTYLMLLADKNYNAVFEINNPDILLDVHYIHLFKNLGINAEEATEQTDFIVVQEAGVNVSYFENFHDSDGLRGVTDVGSFLLNVGEDGSHVLYRNGEEFYSLSAKQNEEVDIRIVVFDKDTMEIVDSAGFSLASQATRR